MFSLRKAPSPPPNNLIVSMPYTLGRAIGEVSFDLSRGAWVWTVLFRGDRRRDGSHPVIATLTLPPAHMGWPICGEALEALQAVMKALEYGMLPTDLGELRSASGRLYVH